MIYAAIVVDALLLLQQPDGAFGDLPESSDGPAWLAVLASHEAGHPLRPAVVSNNLVVAACS